MGPAAPSLAEPLRRCMVPPMDQQGLLAAVTDRLRGDPDLRALFLAGSLGRADGDRWSDVDLVAVVEPEAQEGFAARWRVLLDGIASVVLWWAPRGIKSLLSAVTEDWLRCDLFMVPPDGLGKRARSVVVPLIDPGGLHATLPDDLPPGAPWPSGRRLSQSWFARLAGPPGPALHT